MSNRCSQLFQIYFFRQKQIWTKLSTFRKSYIKKGFNSFPIWKAKPLFVDFIRYLHFWKTSQVTSKTSIKTPKFRQQLWTSFMKSLVKLPSVKQTSGYRVSVSVWKVTSPSTANFFTQFLLKNAPKYVYLYPNVDNQKHFFADFHKNSELCSPFSEKYSVAQQTSTPEKFETRLLKNFSSLFRSYLTH